MIEKRIVCSDRLRVPPKQFSWVDHALVRRKYICDLSHESRSLYLFLVTVGDADGLSYYSDSRICGYLSFAGNELIRSRAELCSKGLIAYQNPLYQVLSLQCPVSEAPCETQMANNRKANTTVESVGSFLRSYTGGAQ